MPGAIGGAGWGGGALDPSIGNDLHQGDNSPAMYKIVQPARSDTVDADYSADLSASNLRVTMPPRDSGQRLPPLPINRPPYGTLTAIDLNTGDTKWTVPLGDSPAIRNHPLLKDLKSAAARRRGIAGADRDGVGPDLRHGRRFDAVRDRLARRRRRSGPPTSDRTATPCR